MEVKSDQKSHSFVDSALNTVSNVLSDYTLHCKLERDPVRDKVIRLAVFLAISVPLMSAVEAGLRVFSGTE